VTDAASLMRGHDAFDRIEEKFNEALDVSLDPAFLFPVMGCSPAAMRPQSTEAAINDAGLRIDRCVILGPEWGERAQEHAQRPGRHLLHAARLIRDRTGTSPGSARRTTTSSWATACGTSTA